MRLKNILNGETGDLKLWKELAEERYVGGEFLDVEAWTFSDPGLGVKANALAES